MEVLNLFAGSVFSPQILFFVLGIIAGILKSDLDIPKQISSYLSIYLIMAIGFKGGVAVAEIVDIDWQVIATIFAGIGTGFSQPFLGYTILKKTTKLDDCTAAAVSAHYGSVSIVTFITTVSFLDANGIQYGGYVVAILALMEIPAILSGLFIVRFSKQAKQNKNAVKNIREIFVNGSVLLLTGSFLIGWLTGKSGMREMHSFFVEPFNGILAFFLLDTGLLVSRQLHHLKEFTFGLAAFGIYMPMIGAAIGLGLSKIIGLNVGTGTLFTVLVASSSYIAVTAAMKMALPEAKVSIYVPMSMVITFPFNVLIGMPLYFTIAKAILSP